MKSLQNQVRQVKMQLADIVAGPQRGIELSWLVIGFVSLRFWHYVVNSSSEAKGE